VKVLASDTADTDLRLDFGNNDVLVTDEFSRAEFTAAEAVLGRVAALATDGALLSRPPSSHPGRHPPAPSGALTLRPAHPRPRDGALTLLPHEGEPPWPA
jgi:hypothetical protein